MTTLLLLFAALGGTVFYLTRPPSEIPPSQIADIKPLNSAPSGNPARNVLPAEGPPRDYTESDSTAGKSDTAGQRQNTQQEQSKSPDPITPLGQSNDSVPSAGIGDQPSLQKSAPAPETKKTLSWDELVASSSFPSELNLPVISKSITNETWLEPITLMSFRSRPELELTLIVSAAAANSAIINGGAHSGDTWSIVAKHANGGLSQLATINIGQNGTDLRFQWLADASKEPLDIIDLMRGAVLQIRDKRIAEAKIISFIPTEIAKEPFGLNNDQLIKNGSWTVPLPEELRIPNGQVTTAEVQLSGIESERDRQIILTLDHSEDIPLNITGLDLCVKFTSMKGEHFALVVLLRGKDEESGEEMLFPKWLPKRIARKRQLLEDAIVTYRRDLTAAKGGPLLTEEAIRKSLPKKIADLASLEKVGFDTVQQVRGQKDPYPQYAPLVAFEKMHGDPSQLTGKLKLRTCKNAVACSHNSTSSWGGRPDNLNVTRISCVRSQVTS